METQTLLYIYLYYFAGFTIGMAIGLFRAGRDKLAGPWWYVFSTAAVSGAICCIGVGLLQWQFGVDGIADNIGHMAIGAGLGLFGREVFNIGQSFFDSAADWAVKSIRKWLASMLGVTLDEDDDETADN